FPHATLAASLMDTSVRTLARRLADSGTSYRSLVDELRFAEAKTLLSRPDTRVTDVAAAVGFEDPSHFARMFRRVGGLSPREFMRSQAQA
ncbi:MAG: helix-turn-helix transcriptional regulator, partial [Verrucomicrobiales bacterium]